MVSVSKTITTIEAVICIQALIESVEAVEGNVNDRF